LKSSLTSKSRLTTLATFSVRLCSMFELATEALCTRYGFFNVGFSS
jgi:hypothetical protein